MKSRMPEIVEPKQLIQSRVLVKRARLTVKRGAARPNGKSKPPQSPLRRAVRYRIRGAARQGLYLFPAALSKCRCTQGIIRDHMRLTFAAALRLDKGKSRVYLPSLPDFLGLVKAIIRQ